MPDYNIIGEYHLHTNALTSAMNQVIQTGHKKILFMEGLFKSCKNCVDQNGYIIPAKARDFMSAVRTAVIRDISPLLIGHNDEMDPINITSSISTLFLCSVFINQIESGNLLVCYPESMQSAYTFGYQESAKRAVDYVADIRLKANQLDSDNNSLSVFHTILYRDMVFLLSLSQAAQINPDVKEVIGVFGWGHISHLVHTLRLLFPNEKVVSMDATTISDHDENIQKMYQLLMQTLLQNFRFSATEMMALGDEMYSILKIQYKSILKEEVLRTMQETQLLLSSSLKALNLVDFYAHVSGQVVTAKTRRIIENYANVWKHIDVRRDTLADDPARCTSPRHLDNHSITFCPQEFQRMYGRHIIKQGRRPTLLQQLEAQRKNSFVPSEQNMSLEIPLSSRKMDRKNKRKRTEEWVASTVEFLSNTDVERGKKLRRSNDQETAQPRL